MARGIPRAEAEKLIDGFVPGRIALLESVRDRMMAYVERKLLGESWARAVAE